MTPRRRSILRNYFTALILGGVIIWSLQATATTRQGVNFTLAHRSIPLYVKILDFVHRDAHYRLLAQDIAAHLTSDEERVLAIFDWTRRNIRPTPPGWPIVDDHILDIIVRGYGVDDQMADVFCVLATYAGVPAFWESMRAIPGQPILVLSFAKVDGVWRVFDVANGVVFRSPQGQLLDVETLLTDPQLADAPARDVPPRAMSYAAYLERLRPFTVPDTLRAEKQMLWPRVVFEVRHVFRGLQHSWQPASAHRQVAP